MKPVKSFVVRAITRGGLDLGLHVHGAPQIVSVRQLTAPKGLPVYAYYRKAAIVKTDCLAYDSVVGVPTTLPKPFANDHHRISARLLVFFREKISSCNHRDSQSPEIIACDQFSHEPLG